MKTSNLGNVAVSTATRKREKFNLTHDVNTTCGFGETQPLVCRLLPPNTKSKMSVETIGARRTKDSTDILDLVFGGRRRQTRG